MEKHEKLVTFHPNLGNLDDANEIQDHGKDVSLEDSTRTPAEKEWENVTRYKLAVVMAACTMAGFLMFLDTSIVATVSQSPVNRHTSFPLISTGHSKDH
jgi:hypothetical protein